MGAPEAGAPAARCGMHVTGSRHPRPVARRVAFCDGGIDDSHREGIDIELSHWIPNRTPAAYKAATSTEICLRFAAGGEIGSIDLAVNNHVDTDGMLSVFALVEPALALEHRHRLVQAAAMGDFGAWAEPDAQHLYQVVALARQRLQAAGADPLDIYREVHELVRRVLRGERFAEAEPGLAGLKATVARIDSGAILRTLHAPRLVQFTLADDVADTGAWLPRLDEPLPAQPLLPPSARSRLDGERLHLVSARHAGGWVHDLCWPGYAWAETVGLWRPPGTRWRGDINGHAIDHAPLQAAAAALAERETVAGRWSVATALTPFSALEGRAFPVVLSFLREGRVAASGLPPEVVAQALLAAGVV